MAPIPEWRAILMKKPDLAPLKEPYIHESCQNELDGMYKDQLTQTVLKRQTEKRLKFFYQHENDFFRYQDFFEPIAKISDGEKVIQYYSWRYNNVRALGNLRILFVVLNGRPFFLHAFKEQHGDASYNRAKEVLRKRLSEGKPNDDE